MKILFAVPELYPLVKTGGLGDVAAALPPALARAGADVRVLMPAYRGLAEQSRAKPVADLGQPLGAGPATLLEGRIPDSGLALWLIDNPALFDRDGGPYLTPDGADWPDNGLRFALLGWAAARLSRTDSPTGWTPDIVHGHDWQAGLTGAYLKSWGVKRPGIVFTIHNMVYPGMFPPDILPRLGLPESYYGIDGLEYWGHVSYLKAGLVFADKLTTVSPTYAREITTTPHGCGMEGILAERTQDLTGILNGADYAVWNPADDPAIERTYDDSDLEAGKAANKAALQRRLGLPEQPDAPLMAVISRLSEQKGMDLLLAALPALLAQGAQLALLGAGDKKQEDAFTALAAARPEQAAVHIGYSEPLAHQLMAGADLFLMPSRFEPCGLTQIYAMRYGTLPVVHRTGGLADTVTDAGYDSLLTGAATGFVFEQPSAAAFQWGVERALAVYRTQPQQWRRIQAAARQRNFGWDAAAADYLSLYRQIRP
ncbi:MAG: glycogen synthase GlgA [Rhodospirillaceae bacterium]|nr:glycogen synthase GlgA [Rhodospirillaceae bacterium]